LTRIAWSWCIPWCNPASYLIHRADGRQGRQDDDGLGDVASSPGVIRSCSLLALNGDIARTQPSTEVESF
jgi:hypothetical protein